jgi:putative tryptophan/tyrosine transport system substrate-binding protein
MRLIGLAVVLAASLVLAPLAAEAQSAGKIYRIGYLSGNPQADPQEAIEAFIEALRNFGFVEGRNLAIEHPYADGDFDRLQRLVEELIQHKVDVILTYGTPATLAAKNATRTIPVVFGAVADPIVAGLVFSLPRPGGNEDKR